MSYEVILYYKGVDGPFYIHLEGTPDRRFIHEFRPKPELAAWLEGRSLLGFRTGEIENHGLKFKDYMAFEFSDLDDALLFKLTWS